MAVFLALVLPLASAVAGQGGTIALRNYAGTPGADPRPVYLEDGVTRAAGTNFVVELLEWDPATGGFGMLATTNLLDGSRAGLFSAGTGYTHVIPGETTVVEVRIWDRTSGKDFASATRRVATAFDNRTGGDGSPPTLPKRLEIQPVCLGNGACFPHPVRYSLLKESDLGLYSPANEFYAADDQTALAVRIQRSGELLLPTSLRLVSRDDSAVAGRDFEALDAVVDFPAYVREQRVELRLIGSRSVPGPVRVRLEALDPADASKVLAEGQAWIFADGDIRIVDAYYHDLDGRRRAEGLTIWAYWTGRKSIAVESTESLEQPRWTTDLQYNAGILGGPLRFFHDDTQRGLSKRFLRVVVR